MKKNMVVRAHDAFRMVVLIGANNPTDSEWAEAVELGRTQLSAAGGDRKRIASLVFTDGGAPNSRQRQLARELYGAEPPPMALVTDSLIARGAAAVFKLFWPSTNGIFSSADWEQALRHVSIASEQRDTLLAQVKAMQDELGPLTVTKPFLTHR